MPTTYAHWRFGCDCIETLPENLKKIVNQNRDLFDFGVHGPDVLFYDLKRPDLFSYGQSIHKQSGKQFFENSINVYKLNDDNKDQMLAYILGFLSHYALDSQCHGYINKKADVTDNLSHNKVESEYDGHLIKLDGKAISQTDRAKSLKPSKFNAMIIARFFSYSIEEIRKAIYGQKFLISALNCKTDFKRNLAYNVLNKLKKYDYADLLIQTKQADNCKDSNLRIDKLKEYALELYPILVNNYCNALDGKEELIDYFDRCFDPIGGDETPILKYEDELNYIPIKDF